MQTITSLDNPLIKRVMQLHEKKGRKEHQQCIVEGVRACETFFASGMRLYHIFVTQEMVAQLPATVKTSADRPAVCPSHKVVIVPERVMSKISTTTTPSGMLAVFAIPTPEVAELQAGLVLAQMQDPGNVGTLIRTAAALNKRSIVMVEGVEPWSPKVIQATAGTIALVKIFQWSWQELLMHKKQLKLCGLVVAGGKTPQELDLSESLLVIGSEGHGLPAEWQNDCDALLTLPMPGNTESLNAAVAGSIALYCSYLR